MQNTNIDEGLIETLTEEKFVPGKDFAIDPHSHKMLLLTEPVRERVQILRPLSILSPVLVEQVGEQWRCVSSLETPPSPLPELADPVLNQFSQDFFVG